MTDFKWRVSDSPWGGGTKRVRSHFGSLLAVSTRCTIVLLRSPPLLSPPPSPPPVPSPLTDPYLCQIDTRRCYGIKRKTQAVEIVGYWVGNVCINREFARGAGVVQAALPRQTRSNMREATSYPQAHATPAHTFPKLPQRTTQIKITGIELASTSDVCLSWWKTLFRQDHFTREPLCSFCNRCVCAWGGLDERKLQNHVREE